MIQRLFRAAITATAFLAVASGHGLAATVTPIPVTGGIFDMVYNDADGILYMTTGGPNVLRYKVAKQHFLLPIKITGNLLGIDISEQGNKLAIADDNNGNGQIWIDDYDLTTGKLEKIYGAGGDLASGTLDVAFDFDGRIAVSVSSQDSGAGFPAFVADPFNRTMTQIKGNGAVYFTEATVFHASPDHKVVAFTAGDISNGPWGTIAPVTATIGIENYTNWFTYDVAVAPLGKYFAIPTYGGTFVADHNGYGLVTLGVSGQTVFTGAAFDPLTPQILYQSLANSSVVQAWDVTTAKIVKTYDTGVSIPWNGNGEFSVGYLRVAAGGKTLFMKTSTGAVAIKLR